MRSEWRGARELTKTTPLDPRASGRGARGSAETKKTLCVWGFGVVACKPKGVSYPSPELTRSGIFCDHPDLLYEHNEMSPLMLLLIMRALFRKKKKKNAKQKIETNLCSCRMQNNEKHFDNVSFFFLLINHKLVEKLSKNERKNAHVKYVCTDWKNYNHNACWNYLELWSQFTFVVFQIRHDKILL